MTNILRVRNLAQKVLWDQELSGQISDGQWENATPWDHWKPWCDAEVVVDPEHVGRNFHARRQSYMFNAKDLLEVVGERMLEAVRIATGDATYDAKRMNNDLADLRKIIKEWVADSVPIPAQPASVSLPEYYYDNGTHKPHFGSSVAIFDADSAQAHARKVLDTIPDGPKPKWDTRMWTAYQTLLSTAAVGVTELARIPERTFTMADFDPAHATL